MAKGGSERRPAYVWLPWISSPVRRVRLGHETTCGPILTRLTGLSLSAWIGCAASSRATTDLTRRNL
jgi:hypothetical protein